MALPAGITPKTVTIGIASFFDGTLADGTATITAPINVVHTPTNRPIFSSVMSQKFVDGVASFTLAPTNAPGLNRVDWTYKLNVTILGALVQPDPIYFTLPTAGPDVVDLDGLVTVPSSAGVPISATVVTSVNGQVGDVTVAGGGGSTLAVAATVTASGALVTGKHNPVSATSGVKAMTLPTGATSGTLLSVEKTDASTNAVNVTGNVRGSAGATISLVWPNEALLLTADSSGSWWPVAGHKTKTALDIAYSHADPVLSNFTYDPTTGNLLSYKEDGITITMTYNADGTVATTQRGSATARTYSYSGGNLVGVA